MKSINDIRRENLRDIIDRDFNGTQSRLAERMTIQANLVSRWVKGHKNIGDNAARKIERVAGRPSNWMDFDHILSVPHAHEENEDSGEIGLIVAANLKKWMESNRTLSSQQKVAAASGVSQATINRLLRNEASITIGNMAAIAAAFGRRAYELAVAPGDTSIIRYDHSRYALLPPAEKEKISSYIEFVLSSSDK